MAGYIEARGNSLRLVSIKDINRFSFPLFGFFVQHGF